MSPEASTSAAITVTERKASLLIDTARAFLQWDKPRQGLHRPARRRTDRARGSRRAALGPPPRPPPRHRGPAQHSGATPSSSPPRSAPPGDPRPAHPRAVGHRVRRRPSHRHRHASSSSPTNAAGSSRSSPPPPRSEFFDPTAVEAQTGSPVRSRYRKPGEPRSEIADVIIVAPATYNTINKWAHGISDTYALGVLAETTGLAVPIVVLPFVNSALASRPPFVRSVEALARRRRADPARPRRHRAAPAPHRRRPHRQLPLAPRPGRSRAHARRFPGRCAGQRAHSVRDGLAVHRQQPQQRYQ